MKKWGLVNVVWYDGKNAYVSQFILPLEWVGNEYTAVTGEGMDALEHYLRGNGEILKTDIQYGLSFAEIVDIAEGKSALEDKTMIIDRFKTMYF